jgi:UPF0755 protein
MKKILILIIIVLAAITIFGYQYYSGAIHYALNPAGTDRITINIRQGDTANDVGSRLYAKGLIKSPAVFRFYLKQHGLDSQIKAGRIVMRENFTLPEIIGALVEGKSSETSVTIPEGWTAGQIADYLASMELTTADEFLRCLRTCEFTGDHLPKGYFEGYLYPDTYFVDPASYSNKQFIQRLINNFESKLDGFPWGDLEKSGKTFEQIMIMASIVEREESDPEERPTVAGILWNRFDANVGLGADATVLYALGRTKGGLTYDDLRTDSPYNTRKYAGLPPTPICNPGITSILAAISPAPTDYWYYLHDLTGQVHYARTLDEHNTNKSRYID